MRAHYCIEFSLPYPSTHMFRYPQSLGDCKFNLDHEHDQGGFICMSVSCTASSIARQTHGLTILTLCILACNEPSHPDLHYL